MPKRSKADQAAKISADEARRRKEVALAGLREFELAERQGQLLRLADVEQTWAATAAMLRDAVLRIPDMAAPQLVGVRDATEARAILAEACDQVLRAVSARLAAASGEPAAQGGASLAPARAGELVAVGGPPPQAVERGERSTRRVDHAAVPARGARCAQPAQPARPSRAHVGKPARKD